MKRTEEIIRASELEFGCSRDMDACKSRNAFINGAEWADAHPHWNDMSKKPREYDDFLVITKSGCMDFAHFNQDGWHKSHYNGSSDFLYWMTPPAKPKGGEE
jgi:hypothetical protein